MPLVTASAVFNGARTYLNDVNGTVWTDTNLLPYLIEAYEYGRNSQAVKGLPNAFKTDEQTITAGTVVYPLIPDLLIPVKVEERAAGEDPSFRVLMTETIWDPTLEPTENLNYWNWRNQDINFLGALTDRVVTVSYMGDMDPTGLTTGSTSLLGNVKSFLSAKTAALVHSLANQNMTQAQICDDIAEKELGKILAVQSKARQAVPGRFRPHVAYPRTWGRFRP